MPKVMTVVRTVAYFWSLFPGQYPKASRDGGGVLIRLFALNTGRSHRRARIFGMHRPQGGTTLGRCWFAYSFVSMSHHTARGKVRPMMG